MHYIYTSPAPPPTDIFFWKSLLHLNRKHNRNNAPFRKNESLSAEEHIRKTYTSRLDVACIREHAASSDLLVVHWIEISSLYSTRWLPASTADWNARARVRRGSISTVLATFMTSGNDDTITGNPHSLPKIRNGNGKMAEIRFSLDFPSTLSRCFTLFWLSPHLRFFYYTFFAHPQMFNSLLCQIIFW